jgi:hypothetical protein
MADDREEKARVLLAINLEHAHAQGFLSLEDVLEHVKKSLIAGLVKLTTLHGGKIVGAFHAHWRGKKDDNVSLFLAAFVGKEPFYEVMLEKVDEDTIPKIFEDLIESGAITWDNLVAAFPYRSLLACVREGLERAEDAVPKEDEVAAPAEVAEEDVEDTEDVEIERPGDDSGPHPSDKDE